VVFWVLFIHTFACHLLSLFRWDVRGEWELLFFSLQSSRFPFFPFNILSVNCFISAFSFVHAFYLPFLPYSSTALCMLLQYRLFASIALLANSAYTICAVPYLQYGKRDKTAINPNDNP